MLRYQIGRNAPTTLRYVVQWGILQDLDYVPSANVHETSQVVHGLLLQNYQALLGFSSKFLWVETSAFRPTWFGFEHIVLEYLLAHLRRTRQRNLESKRRLTTILRLSPAYNPVVPPLSYFP